MHHAGHTLFVGRTVELAALRTTLDELRAGLGRLILIAGEPGIGKTRLAEEVAACAQRDGAHVLWGRCYEGEGAPAFWPWVQILRAAIRHLESDLLSVALGPGAADIAQLVPEVRDRLPGVGRAPVPDSPHARFRMFDSVARFLEHLARRAPVVLTMDDMHSADRPSLLLLEFLVRELREVPVLMLGCHRTVALPGTHPLTQTIAEVVRVPEVTQLTLGGLSPSEVRQLLEQSVGVQASASLVAAVHESTEGNPLFVSEYVRLLVAEAKQGGPGDPRGPLDIPLPRGIKDVVACRTAPLSACCKQVLAVAAVVGREVQDDVVAAVVAADGAQPFDHAAVAAALAEAQAAGIVDDAGGGRWRFNHGLVREVLYDGLSAARRLRLHRHVGEALERRPDVEGRFAELAHHFVAAGPEVDPSQAVLYAHRAGDRALALFAYEEAARMYETALGVLDDQRLGDNDRHCELLLALGDAQACGGARSAARTTSLRAAAVARRVGAAQHFARAALGFGWVFELNVVDEARIELLEQALRILDPQDSALRSRVTARLALALHWVPDAHARRDALSEQAVEMARRIDDRAALACALHARLYSLWEPARLADRIAIARELVRLAEASGDKQVALEGRHWLVMDLLEAGEIGDAELAMAAHARAAADLRQPQYLWFAKLWEAMRALLDGRFAAAEELVRTASALEGRAGPGRAERSILFWIMRERGALSAFATETAAFLEERAHRQGGWRTLAAEAFALEYRSGLAFAYSELGMASEARHEFEAIIDQGFEHIARQATWLPTMSLVAETCAFLNDVERAQQLYAALLPYAGRNVVTGFAGGCSGSLSRQLGLLATTLGRWAEAEGHFRDALRMHAGLKSPPLTARTQCDYATMLQRRGSPTDEQAARALLDAALITARTLGMQGLESRVSGLLSLVSGSTESGPASAITTQPPAAGNREPETRNQERGTNLLRQEGDYWTIRRAGEVVRVKDSKGVRYIAHLLRHAGQQVHVFDLVGPGSAQIHAEARALRRGTALREALPVLDAQARSQYTSRVAELREELAQAEGGGDVARAASVWEEIAFISRQLAAAIGLGGRQRGGATDAERARIAVTKRIRDAIVTIQRADAALGSYLTTSIKTGVFCVYAPTQSSEETAGSDTNGRHENR